MNAIKEIVREFKQNNKGGIFSVCCSNKYVIEAAMDRLRNKGMYLLIESTANQVDQFGGYTGMKPKDFVNYVYKIADENKFPRKKILLGGDHLGPLTWTNLDEKEAMENSKELIRQYVMAGYTKIHIDTSMPLKDDIKIGIYNDNLIAQRAAELCKVSEEAYKELKKDNVSATHPVYIIGSEVPTPGGVKHCEDEKGVVITRIKDLKTTIDTFKNKFHEFNIYEAWDFVVGVVVQPGVEFGSDYILEYDRESAKDLSEVLKEYPSLVFEAHSTDYQTPQALRNMVQDGFIILKVGPALTYGFREGAFALNDIENEMFKYNANIELSKFRDVLDFIMANRPNYWKNYYSGCGENIKIERKYSLSDRCRYYMPMKEVEFSLNKMINNLNKVDIPITLISQFMHSQYKKIRLGEMKLTPENLIKDRIGEYIDDYIYAVSLKK